MPYSEDTIRMNIEMDVRGRKAKGRGAMALKDKAAPTRVGVAHVHMLQIGGLLLTLLNIDFMLRSKSGRPMAWEWATSPATIGGNNEYILYSRRETYNDDCKRSILHNDTWGGEVYPLVDKIEVKHILRKWMDEDEEFESLGLKIVPTLEVFTPDNATLFTLDMLKRLPEPYIIKTAHGSGGIGKVYGGTNYRCLKGNGCDKIKWLNIERNFSQIYDFHIKRGLFKKSWYQRYNREPQYQFIAPSIVIEKDILAGNNDIRKDITRWFVSNGVALFASQQCFATDDPDAEIGATSAKRKCYSARYEPLHMATDAHGGFRKICDLDVPKPKTWERQRRIAEQIAKRLPGGGVARIDLYAGEEEEIYFSEITLTPGGCEMGIKPAVVDGMLWALANGRVSIADARRPEYVEGVIHANSWMLVERRGDQIDIGHTRSFPSPLDLCEYYHNRGSPARRDFDQCIQVARSVSGYPVRVAVEDNVGNLSSFGLYRRPESNEDIRAAIVSSQRGRS